MVNTMQPPWIGLPPVGEYPFVETHDLRTGPALHQALLGLLPLVGVWRGRGKGEYPVGHARAGEFDFGQEVRFSHGGRPVLRYESRSWLLDDAHNPVAPLDQEVGWWRPVVVEGADTDELEVSMAYQNGVQELYLGRAVTTTQFELSTDAVVRTATSAQHTAGHRLYGVVEGALLYAHDLASAGQPLRPYMSARLERVAG